MGRVKVSKALAIQAAEAGRQPCLQVGLGPQVFFPLLICPQGSFSGLSAEDWLAAPTFREVMLVFFKKIYFY